MKIAISGKMGSGKSTIANYLVEKYGFTHASFAKAIKDSAIDIFGLTTEEAYGKGKKRELLQDFGSKMRELDKDVWVNKVINDIEDMDNVVIDDLRYDNEYDALKKAGFTLIRLQVLKSILKERIGDSYQNPDHISETALDNKPFEIYVENIGSKKSLFKVIDTIIKEAVERI